MIDLSEILQNDTPWIQPYAKSTNREKFVPISARVWCADKRQNGVRCERASNVTRAKMNSRQGWKRQSLLSAAAHTISAARHTHSAILHVVLFPPRPPSHYELSALIHTPPLIASAAAAASSLRPGKIFNQEFWGRLALWRSEKPICARFHPLEVLCKAMLSFMPFHMPRTAIFFIQSSQCVPYILISFLM
jgi:hypothetical protein